MQPDDRIRLEHMIEAGETIATFVSGRTRPDLDSDRMLLFAVVRHRDPRRGGEPDFGRGQVARTRGSLAGDRWHAQPHRARLLGHRRGHRLEDGC
jgi:hypothetical protein